MDDQPRAILCNYPLNRDCVNQLTGRQILAQRQFPVTGNWDQSPVLRVWVDAGIRYHGIYGQHSEVVQRIRRMLDDRGFQHLKFEVATAAEDSINLYIVGRRGPQILMVRAVN